MTALAIEGAFAVVALFAMVGGLQKLIVDHRELVRWTREGVLVSYRNAKTSERMADVVCAPKGEIAMAAAPSGIVTTAVQEIRPIDPKATKH